LWRETPNSSAMPSKAGMMAEAVKVVIMAWTSVSGALTEVCISSYLRGMQHKTS
jgi:hypothetical protein